MNKYWLEELKTKYERSGYQFLESIVDVKEERKKVLLLSHQMSITGAPQALFIMAKCMQQYVDVIIATVEDGPLEKECLAEGIPVVRVGRYWQRKVIFKSFAKNFDGIVANTVLNFPAVMILDGTDLPVFWWIHEHENYFEYGRGEIPDPNMLSSNVKVLAVAEYVKQVIKNEFDYEAEILHVGVERLQAQQNINCALNDTIKFVVVGTYGMEKGQDLVVQAYRELDETYRKHIELYFIGNEEERDEIVYEMVRKLESEYEQVHMSGLMPREKILELYQKCDGAIVSSRREVMSMVGIEQMMLGKCLIVSSGAGNYTYVKDGENGYTFLSEDIGSLSRCLEKAWRNRAQFMKIGEAANIIYEKVFSLEQFGIEIKKIVDLL